MIAVDDVWFYVTAGHVPRFIQSSIDAGGKFDVWRLGDQTARGPFKDIGIPFDFVVDLWLVIEDNAVGLDYAALPLRDLYRQALERGGIIPIRKDAWGDHVTEYDQWVLVGVPAETVTHDGSSLISAKVVSVALEETEAPNGAGTKSDNQFYGRLIDGSEAVVKNVEGMSAGIYAFLILIQRCRPWILIPAFSWNSDLLLRFPSPCEFLTGLQYKRCFRRNGNSYGRIRSAVITNI